VQPFQNADEWQKAYLTDMIQDLVDHDVVVNCALIERGWAEFDTEEDYQRLPRVAEQQRLFGLVETVDPHYKRRCCNREY
jgi:hypothetical protein